MGRAWTDKRETLAMQRDGTIFSRFLGWLASHKSEISEQFPDLKPPYESKQKEIEFYSQNAIGMNTAVTSLISRANNLSSDFVRLELRKTSDTENPRIKSWRIGTTFSATGRPIIVEQDQADPLAPSNSDLSKPTKYNLFDKEMDVREVNAISDFSNYTGRVTSLIQINSAESFTYPERRNCRTQGDYIEFVVDPEGYVSVWRNYIDENGIGIALDNGIEQPVAYDELSAFLASLSNGLEEQEKFQFVVGESF